MFELFNEETIRILYNSQIIANKLEHPYTGPEHILLSILKSDSIAFRKLMQRGITYTRVELLLKEIYAETYKKKDIAKKNIFQINFSKKMQLIYENIFGKEFENNLPKFSNGCKRIFRKCFFHSYRRREIISIELILAILLLRKNGLCGKILENFPVKYDLVISELHFYLRNDFIKYYRLIYNRGKIKRIYPSSYFVKLFSKQFFKVLRNYYRSVCTIIPNTKTKSRIHYNFLQKQKALPKIMEAPGLRKYISKTLKKKYKKFGMTEYNHEIEKIIFKYFRFQKNKNITKPKKRVKKNRFNFLYLTKYFFYPKNIFYRNFEITYKMEYDFYLSYKNLNTFNRYSFKNLKSFKFPSLLKAIKKWKKATRINQKELQKYEND